MKRALLTDGYAEPTYRFLNQVDATADRGIHPTDGQYIVNVSFDLELSMGTYFWSNDFANARMVGERARTYLKPTMDLLTRESIAYNIQILGMLLEPRISELSIFTNAQRTCIQQYPALFHLEDEIIELMDHERIDVGIHGYSHRVFTELSQDEADAELTQAIQLFMTQKTRILRTPTFMAFPRNYFAHTHLLSEHGIESWRSNMQAPYRDGRMPRGVWFAPGILNPKDLTRVIDHIQKTQPGYLLHLWNHFTEMDTETFAHCIDVFRSRGWKFMNIRDFRTHYAF